MELNRRLIVRTAAFCLLIVGVCYANSIHNDFILDDFLIVASNPDIRNITPVHFLLSPFWGEKGPAGIYRPLVILSFSIEYSIWHRWAPGFRLGNLLLHAINGFLVFLLARSLIGSIPAAWAATAVYLAHPVHTEAVAGIAGRSELLAAMFFFLAWLLFRQRRTALCAVAFLLSLLSKENAIAFPAVIVLDKWISEGSFKKVLPEWRRFALVASSAAVYLALRLLALGSIAMPQSAQYLGGRWTLLQREFTSGRAFLKYFQLLVAPLDVTGDYDFNSIPLASAGNWDAWLGLLMIAATILFAFRVSKKQPVIGFAILFFYITMLPMSNWLIPTGLIMAERYLYVPSLGFALIVGMIWANIRGNEVRRILGAGVMAVAALLCISHNYVWQDNLTFYSNMVRVLPENIRGRQGYGVALVGIHRTAEAREQFEAGLRIARNAPLLVGLAGVRIQMEHNCDSARPLLNEALSIQRSDYFARWTLAECLEREGEMTMAEQTYRQAVADAQFPDPRLLFDWGRSLEGTRRPSEALEAYRRAALIDPNDFAIKQKLARLSGPLNGSH